MRWLVDECVDGDLVGRLRTAGHDILYAAEMASGATDTELMQQAFRDDRLLLTEDKDFGELAFRLGLPVPGLVLLRLRPERRLLKWPRLKEAIERFGGRLFGRYVVVEEARFRSRPLFDSTRG